MQNMFVKVHVIAGAKKERIHKVSEDLYEISVKEPAERNMANMRIRELLSLEFAVPKGKVRIVTGHRSPSKIFDILTS